MATPASLYAPSPRAYPERLAEVEYPTGYQRRRVDETGKFTWHDRKVFVSHALEHQTVGLGRMIEPSVDGEQERSRRTPMAAADRYWLVRFASMELGVFDVSRARLLCPRERRHLLK
jgi:hypothetical protein